MRPFSVVPAATSAAPRRWASDVTKLAVATPEPIRLSADRREMMLEEEEARRSEESEAFM